MAGGQGLLRASMHFALGNRSLRCSTTYIPVGVRVSVKIRR